jgi:hypothetical protein
MADRRAFELAVFLIIELPARRADATQIKGSGGRPTAGNLNLKKCV